MATARKSSTKATVTKVDLAVVKVGHAFIKGKGPNDKPKKDSLWGLLQAGDKVVKFFGRRGGAVRFKFADSMDEGLALYQQKLDGTDAKKLKHVDLDAAKQTELLGTDWPQSLFDKYKQTLADGKVDQRAKAPAEQPAAPAAKKAPAQETEQQAAQEPWPWPKSPVAA
ncbi:hypothetical protein [Burkholderia multivorans]|uniref:hypothetical protein n=1 Tax=Burkholderia multivorans TaxID=87883 RepID=UPI0002781B42|nr:hypothetical protein [Burkholderia multivorans]EJO57340.1 hypothetical protein BURMUCF2_A1484 [Burkholderia multivorans CF2]MBU9472091.1 hypothetical protein [Burkholderia multivorans]